MKRRTETHTPMAVHRLDVYRVSMEMVREVSQVVGAYSRFDGALGSQLKRAAPSVALNLAEGMRRTGQDRRYLLGVAMGSAAEVETLMDVGVGMGIISEGQARPIAERTDRIQAMLYRLRQRMA